MGFWADVSRGIKARERQRYDRMRIERGRRSEDEVQAQLEEHLRLERVARIAGHNEEADKHAAEARDAKALLADIQIAILFDKW